MSTLPERILRLEQELGSASAGTLIVRVGRLEVCCFGSETVGPLLQRLSKLEALAGFDVPEPHPAEIEPVDRDMGEAEVDASNQVGGN